MAGVAGEIKSGANAFSSATGDSQTGAQIILGYFTEVYRPAFRRGSTVVCVDGTEVQQAVACGLPTTALIDRLAVASDAPTFKGGAPNRNALPSFFKTWGRVAWGDLLASLPDEDAAELGGDAPVAEDFRRLVREALLSDVVLGDVIGTSTVTQTERRPLIRWCQKFAKPGPWKDIRGRECFCKLELKGGGEVVVRVAIRCELFSQLRADKRLVKMGENRFTRLAKKYGVGSSTRTERPRGRAAVVLEEDFTAELLAGLPEEDDPLLAEPKNE